MLLLINNKPKRSNSRLRKEFCNKSTEVDKVHTSIKPRRGTIGAFTLDVDIE